MALSTSKVSPSAFATRRMTTTRLHGTVCSFSKSKLQNKLHSMKEGTENQKLRNTQFFTAKFGFSSGTTCGLYGQSTNFTVSQRSSMICLSMRTHRTEEEECASRCSDSSDICRSEVGEEEDEKSVGPGRIINCQGLAEACKFVYNDAKFVNERARNDIVLLSRGIMRLDARARKGVAILGSGFLKLDARAREDTEKIDRDVKKKAERLHHIATIITDRAQSKLKHAADEHWSDGALEADLRRADFRAKQRAMEDALMALEFVKNIHDLMVSKMYRFPLRREKGQLSDSDMLGCVMLEKNGRATHFFPGEVSTDRINAIQEAYWSMACALSEADGIDYTDPEELELLITTLIDLDAMDGKSSVSLLAECSSSPDVNTRQALANALAAAPSMWTLGNAGMGALQRLAEDRNPAIATAASKTIYELKKQWEIEEGDSWRFMMNQELVDEVDGQKDNDDTDTE